MSPLIFAPRRAVVDSKSAPRRDLFRVVVIGETPTRWRCRIVDTFKLSRQVYRERGSIHLLPKTAVRFVQDTSYWPFASDPES